MKKIICVLTIITICWMSSVGYAKSIDEKIVIGYTEFEPFNYTDNGQLIGFDTELAKYVCSKLGLIPEFVEINWDSKEVELDSENIDCVWNALTSTEERKMVMSLTDTYITCVVDFEGEQSTEEYSVALKKGNPLTEKINMVLSEAREDGTVEKLVKKYNINEVENNKSETEKDNLIKVSVNSNNVIFDTEPIIIQDRTFVPIRAVCERLGADVYWYDEEQTVIIVKNDKKIILGIDNDEMSVLTCKNFEEFKNAFEEDDVAGNQVLLDDMMKSITLDVEPIILNNRTLLPIRAVCEALGTTVLWNDATNTVEINCAESLVNEKNTDKTFFEEICEYNNEITSGTKNKTVNGDITFVDSEGNVIINKKDIKDVNVVVDNVSGTCIELSFTGHGRKKFAEATESISKKQNGENYIAICVNGETISAPVVASEIDSDTCIISGYFSMEEAQNLAKLIIGE